MQARLLSRWGLAATLALIALGGFTRGSGSGYGCEDRWPLCEGGLLGGLLPRADFNMIVEWSHRWLAALVGLLAILTAIAAWRTARRWVAWTAAAAVVVIGIQAWVGRLIVANDLDADLVSLHLVVSMTVAGLLAVVAVGTTPLITPSRVSWTIRFATAGVVAAAALFLGSLVHNVYVPGWPLTLDRVVPDLGSRTIALHFLHRAAAAAALVIAALLSWQIEHEGGGRVERIATHVATTAISVNVALGAAHVFTKVQWSGLVALHLLVASIALVAYVISASCSAGLAEDPTARAGAAGARNNR